ncbi:putative quinol monooxygenase [Paenibacillus crassostreae]|uniref:Monooxygenase n=1 Tax=Paenibacillus crassostreae TaxID=1763538 RepID=A0A167F8C4_9BACL|nr:putative quinol monooxygenase [Paenibacillus crassostreae]AOZ90934.1 antibiotic biosynthesis monooxygenase [Paenibacillus crassostreae]OAB76299.1 monooxygenase [Paenibacillus crassostreae]
MIIIHAEMKVNREVEAEFLDSVQELIELSRAEAGNVSYKLLQDTDKDDTYLMVEQWKDQEAVGAHNTSSHFQAFVAKAPKYLTAPLHAQAFIGQPIGK